MHINFVTLVDETMASQRFRVLKPYEILKNLGHTVTVKRWPDMEADINIFHKHEAPHQIMDWLLKIKTYKIFDVCDDHFDREFGGFYRQACEQADMLTCTNSRMEKRLKELFPSKKVKMFYDPINTIQGEPKVSENPKIIWFGHNTNLTEALPWLEYISKNAFDLTVVSNIAGIKGADFKFIPFQSGWVEENLKNYDIVLLPTGIQPWVNMKSENRFVDALNAGSYVLYNNDVLYEKLKPYGAITTLASLQETLEEYRRNPKVVLGKIERGQKFINKEFGDAKLSEQWKEILNDAKPRTNS